MQLHHRVTIMNQQEAHALRTKVRDMLNDYGNEPMLLLLGIPTSDEYVISTLHATNITMQRMAEIIGVQLGQVLYDSLEGMEPSDRVQHLLALADEIKDCMVQAIMMKRLGIHLNKGAQDNDRNPFPF